MFLLYYFGILLFYAGSLRASVSVSVATAVNNSSSGNGSDPLLYGQTEAYADPFGAITITDMMLRAVPGPYTLTVSLPDYSNSQVSVLRQHQWLSWQPSLCPRHCHSQCSLSTRSSYQTCLQGKAMLSPTPVSTPGAPICWRVTCCSFSLPVLASVYHLLVQSSSCSFSLPFGASIYQL